HRFSFLLPAVFPCPDPPTHVPSTLPYTTLFRSVLPAHVRAWSPNLRSDKACSRTGSPNGPHYGAYRSVGSGARQQSGSVPEVPQDRKSTRLNSSHVKISYAVFCLKKNKPRHAQ